MQGIERRSHFVRAGGEKIRTVRKFYTFEHN